MKKSLLNTAVTTALAAALLSGSVLNTQAYAAEPDSSVNNSNNDAAQENYMLPGIGVGAATGAVVAGPVGMLIGGVIGALVGSNQEVTQDAADLPSQSIVATASVQDNSEQQVTDYSASTEHEDIKHSATTGDSEQELRSKNIHLAQLGPINTVVDDSLSSQQDTLLNILTTDLSLDIYFRSGSTDIESFYPARLAAIADLMNNMDRLQLHLDGYTDRRGNKTQNIALAKQRIDKVRAQLISAGVDENRIISKAFGEMQMVSTAGDLEAYTFDRKVVIRFQRASADSIQSMASTLSKFEAEEDIVANNGNADSPVITNAGKQF